MTDLDSIIKYSKDLTLLYVEDNQDAREMTSVIFEDFFDSMIVAVDGQDGVEKFKENKIDIIITDINMPKMNGLEMSKVIREINKEVPIIIISAHNEDDFFMESITLGINSYILKPIDIEQLLSVLSQVLEKYKYQVEAKENLHFLEAYKDVVNLRSIVSKADTKGVITFVNDAFCKISGYTKDELIGKNHNIVRHPENPKAIFEDMWRTIAKEHKAWQGIVRNRAKDGTSYYVDSIVMPILDLDGKVVEYISLRNDISQIMNPSRLLKDALKDLQQPLLIYMKLDQYDMIEEFYDHDTVEKIQKKARIYLENQFKRLYKFNRIYPLGNGEFALLIDQQKISDTKETFIANIKQLQDMIKEDKISLENIDYDISILISIVYTKDKALDSAKIGIKQLIKNNKSFILADDFANKEQQKALENMETVSMIQNALKTGNIVSYFQPIVDNQTKMVVKYESLVRLIDDNGKVLSPFFFLDTAKKSNYYTQITNTVLNHSFSVLKSCCVDISINLSALDIEKKSTREYILGLLDKYSDYTSRVVFELLEDENVKEFEVIKQFIVDVKKYGVKIAIDDFGAGYSNYERLLDYQPDILKIDGCLIRDIETSSYSLSAVKSIVTFAKEQNIQTIAEFIENESIFNIVKDLGVNFSQGYYFGKPDILEV